MIAVMMMMMLIKMSDNQEADHNDSVVRSIATIHSNGNR
jgi:hypothetical protein